MIHKVGDDASICAQTGSGASAQLLVIAPDRTPHTLGEFQTPADRVCYTLKVDQPDLWVLTLIIRDANAQRDRPAGGGALGEPLESPSAHEVDERWHGPTTRL